jgi:hypothetical protein
VVDRSGQFVEKLREAVKVGSIKGHSALRVEFARYLLKALGIPASEDQLGPLSVGSSGRFEPNPSAAADYNDSLPEKFRFAPNGNGGCCGAHNSSRIDQEPRPHTGSDAVPALSFIAASLCRTAPPP